MRVPIASRRRPIESPIESAAKDDFEEETLQAGARDTSARADLPSPNAVFTRVDDSARAVDTMERRFLKELDGIVPLRDIAKAIGVNILRAQFLAAALTKRALVKDTGMRARELETLSDTDE